jgi:hypothetical protein
LIQSLYRHNLGNKKKEEEFDKNIKSDPNTSFYLTELQAAPGLSGLGGMGSGKESIMPVIGKEKENDTSDANKNSEGSIKFSPYDGFGLRANLNGARFKGSKNKFAPMSVEGNTVT